MDTHSPTEPKPETEQSLLPVIQKKSSALHVHLIYGVVGIVIVATTIGILFL